MLRLLPAILLASCIALPAFAIEADELAKPAIQEVTLPSPELGFRGRWNEPTKLTTAAELNKFLGDAIPEKLPEVDFEKSQLLIFAWAGSGRDKLSYEISDNSESVTFNMRRGLTRDLRQHRRSFIVPKALKISFGGK